MGKLKWTKKKVKKIEQMLKKGHTRWDIAEYFDSTKYAIDHVIRNHRIKIEEKTPIKKKKDLKINIKELDDDNFEKQKEKAKTDWEIIKSKRKKRQKKRAFKTILITADQHVPHQDTVAVKSILQLMDDVSFDGFYIVGDFMDMEPISHWLQHKRKTLEGKRMKEDYIKGNALLDEFDKRLSNDCDKRYWFGNHCLWIYQLYENMPALEGMLYPTTELHLKERGYEVYENENHIERVGRLSICHGMYHTINYLRKHLQEFKTNVLIGHMHEPRQRFDSSPAKDIATAGYSVGSLCNMNPDYKKNRPSRWAHGFGIFYLFENGWFDIDIKRIVKGKFVYNGKIYDGNK